MKTAVPSYYSEFKCVADRCKNTCCRGWEIDIDADTLDLYKRMPGALGERLRANIAENAPDEEAPAHFVLDAEEKCPFLNSRGLCDIITEAGEGCLCQICADHPRFRNFRTDVTEVGLGLACEEAARVILSYREKVSLVTIEDDGEYEPVPEYEKTLFDLRDELTRLLQDRSRDMETRFKAFCARAGIAYPGEVNTPFADDIQCE